MCVLSIKVPKLKMSGNLFNDACTHTHTHTHTHIYIYIYIYKVQILINLKTGNGNLMFVFRRCFSERIIHLSVGIKGFDFKIC